MSQIDTEKKTKTQKFDNFMQIFTKFLTNFVNWNGEKGQPGKKVLSSMPGKGINAVF